jgi:hypothetical protein
VLLSFFEWLGGTVFSRALQRPTVFSVVDIIHQLGMALFIGTIAIVSLRLLGLLMAGRPVSEVAGNVRWGTTIGLTTMLITGPLMAAGEPVRWYGDNPFRVKMSVLLLALIFHFTLYRRMTKRDDGGRVLQGFTGIAALLLWFGVGWVGRFITVL